MQMKYPLRRCRVPKRYSSPTFHDCSEPSLENFEELKRFFRFYEVTMPEFPHRLHSQMVQDSRQQPWWATAKDINEVDFMNLLWDGDPTHLVDYLKPGRDDFVHIGIHPGRGGLVYGMICRIGPVLIAQQTVRHINRTPPRSNQEDLTQGMHAFNTTWNDTFSSLQSLLNEDLRVVVLYSDIQNYAHIWSKAPEGTLAQRPAQQSEFISFERDRTRKAFIDYFGRECDPIRDHNAYNDILREADVYDELLKWNIVEDGRTENFEQRLQQLIEGPDEILAIAARHLLSLPLRRRFQG